jgi:hypothetical protein
MTTDRGWVRSISVAQVDGKDRPAHGLIRQIDEEGLVQAPLACQLWGQAGDDVGGGHPKDGGLALGHPGQQGVEDALPKAVTPAAGGQSLLDLIEPEDAGGHDHGGLKRPALAALDEAHMQGFGQKGVEIPEQIDTALGRHLDEAQELGGVRQALGDDPAKGRLVQTQGQTSEEGEDPGLLHRFDGEDGPVGAQQQFQIVKVVHGAAGIYQESPGSACPGISWGGQGLSRGRQA